MESDQKDSRCTPIGFLQKLDIFGTNIALAYDKKYEFKTSIGGMFSLVQHIIMGLIVVTLIIRMVNRKDVNVIETTVRRDQPFVNDTTFIFENKKFMIGVAQRTFSLEGLWTHEHTKLTLGHYSYKDDSETREFIELPFEVWNETHFPASVLEGARTDLEYLWVPFSNLSIEGSFFTKDIKNFAITVEYVPNDECAMTSIEYINDLDHIELNLI